MGPLPMLSSSLSDPSIPLSLLPFPLSPPRLSPELLLDFSTGLLRRTSSPKLRPATMVVSPSRLTSPRLSLMPRPTTFPQLLRTSWLSLLLSPLSSLTAKPYLLTSPPSSPGLRSSRTPPSLRLLSRRTSSSITPRSSLTSPLSKLTTPLESSWTPAKPLLMPSSSLLDPSNPLSPPATLAKANTRTGLLVTPTQLAPGACAPLSLQPATPLKMPPVSPPPSFNATNSTLRSSSSDLYILSTSVSVSTSKK